MTPHTSNSGDRAVKVVSTMGFVESRKGTPLEDRSSFETFLNVLISDPTVGKPSKIDQAIRIIEYKGTRVFYTTLGDEIHLIAVDTEGPERAPTPAMKRTTARLTRLMVGLINQFRT